MKTSILIVDDDENFRTLLRGYLESLGHQILEAEDGAQAFMLAVQQKPGLIVMDLVMPGVYGTTAIKLLADYRKSTNTPILIVSGATDKSLVEQAMALPNIRFLRKPFPMPELGKIITEMLPASGAPA